MSATATKRARKQQIREDKLVTTTVRFSEWAQTHFNQVIIGIVALVAVVAVLVFAANSRENNARQAERVMGSALALMLQGDYTAAKSSFQQVADRFGGKQAVAARFFKGECGSKQGNFEEALADYEAYLASSSEYPEFESAALIGKALCLEGMKNYTEAAPVMAAAVAKLDPKDPRYADAALNAGDLYTVAGNPRDALTYYQLASEHGTGDVKARATVAVELTQ
jgi:tetratricopeptide (TPR) repeat protein